MQVDIRPNPERLLHRTESLTIGALAAGLAALPAVSVQAAAWSEHLEPLPVLAVAGAVVAALLARASMHWSAGHVCGLGGGLVAVGLVYVSFMPSPKFLTRLDLFMTRVLDWLSAAFGGTAGTDNLLFAFTMGLLAWMIGHLAAWGTLRAMSPWWAILPSGAALLLNLSYAQPDLLPLVFLHLAISMILLINLGSAVRAVRWRSEQVEHTFHQGFGLPLATAALGIAVIVGAWRLPVGDVNRGVAAAWENVAGPWQSLQTTFDRVFASLSPSTVSGRGLTAAQTMAPRGAFELGDKPIIRVAGREPAYWRAVTYDQYTGRVMTSSTPSVQRLDRRQPIDGAIEPDAARKIVEYTVTLLAPSSSVLYAPEAPLTVSLPSAYEHRSDRHDFSSLKPVVPVREQQRYGVLAAVSTASAAELRQAETEFPGWVRSSYLQLPSTLPDAVRQQSWRVVGGATNSYDRAASIEQFLRGLSYSTRVPVPPADRDWVSFLIFESKEGYCDYFATAMTVMLRAVGVPARVASGYVTGDWDALTQSYVVTERHAHSWAEVYFPRYGWIAFEPSANRPVPPRLERPIPPLSDEDIARLAESEFGLDPFFEEDDFLESGGLVALPGDHGPVAFSLPLIGAAILFVLLIVLAAAVAVWISGVGRVAGFARPYAQVVRLGILGGFGPRPSQTPYEYARELTQLVPQIGAPLNVVTTAYVGGRYGGWRPEGDEVAQLTLAGREARRAILAGVLLQRLRSWLVARLGMLTQPEQRRGP